MEELLILVGPTAVGKTELSISLAEEINAEIISADSMQVYKGMDIGTAKPTREERARVPHHMIDIENPRYEFSVGEYLRRAEEVIDDIRKRGRVPLVVGGTGLYVRALTEGIFEGPAADWELRDELLERERINPGSLHAELQRVDPDAARKIHPSDVRRTVRALEVFYKEGAPISAIHKGYRAEVTRRPAKIVGLRRARPELYKRIEARVDAMMEQGLLEEVVVLKERGCTRRMVSMQALGYKQLMAFLDGETTLEEAVRVIKRDTKRYAKRQFTWFNADKSVRWVDIGGLSKEEALGRIKKALEILPDIG